MITKIRASNGIWYAKWIIPYSNGKYARRSLETRDEDAAELKLHQFKLENGQLIHNSNIKLSDLYSKYFSLYTEYGKKAKYELYPLRFFIEYMKKDVFCDSITGYDIERYKIWRSKQKRQVWNKRQN